MDAQMPSLSMLAGSLPMPGLTAPKLQWVREHEPALFAQVDKVLLPKDHLRLRLTGECISDLSDASGTLWLDVAARQWSDDALALTGLTRAHMPRLVEGSAVGGMLSAQAARAWGLRPGTLVAGGAGDNAASAVGMGCIQAGQGFVSLGTSGVIFAVTPCYLPNPASATHAFCHALPGLWHQMAVMLTAASALQWAARLVGAASPAALEAQAAALSPAQRAAAPVFLPYLSGERTPHNDVHARGLLQGLTHDTDASALGYAVIEGVSFGLADGLQALRMAGANVSQLALVGGGARSAMWAQLLASCLDVRITLHDESSAGAALGAARLAWLASGGQPAAVCPPPPLQRSFEPQAPERALLQQRLQRYRALYPALRASLGG